MDNTYDMEPLCKNVADEIEDDALSLPSIEEEDREVDHGYIDEAETKQSTTQGCFTILTESKIKQLQEAEIDEVSSVIWIPKAEACLLLTHYGWSAMKVHEAWFADEERTRKAVGLLLNEPQVRFNLNSEIHTCEICFDTLSSDKIKSAKCGHAYCIDCWKQYVDTKIQEGPYQCLKLRCPDPSCDAAVDGDMIHQFASKPNKNKYDRFVLLSYVETNKNMKWCPSPGCDCALVYEPDGTTSKFLEATCLGYHSFCWKCGEDAHRPVSCETVAEWTTKNQSEFESTLWIFAYTKQCPGCNRLIEKDMGCMHMTCTFCGYQFCWLCLRKWVQCFSIGCNRFSDTSSPSERKEELETRRMEAKGDLKRYTHYYERWATNEFSRKKALEIMVSYINAKSIRKLSNSYQRPEDDFEFLKVAWGQVIECRRVLKWTYAYGYFIPDDEEAKKEFFEYTQGVAENALEQLHQCAERVLRRVLNGKKGGFVGLRLKLMHLTNVTKNFFENLVKSLENNGLDDVNVKSYAGVKRGSNEIGESSTSQRGSGRTISIRNGMTEHGLWKCQDCGNYNLRTSTVCPCHQYHKLFSNYNRKK